MNIQIERSSLDKALSFCHSVSEKKSTMPILSYGLLVTQKNCIRILATDLEVYLQTSIPCQALSEGTCCVPIRSLASIVKDLEAEEIQLKLTDNQSLEITCGKAFFRLNTLPPEDFPSLELTLGRKGAKITSQQLANALDLTLFSMSSDETQMELNSVVLDLSQENLCRMVSTDRHRLSCLSFPQAQCQDKAMFEGISRKKFIVPRKGATELRHLCELAGKESVIGIFENQKNLLFQHEQNLLYVRLIEGDFPNYSGFVDSMEGFQEHVIERQKFLSALKRTSVLSSEKLKSVQLTFAKNQINLYSTSEMLGDARESVDTVSSEIEAAKSEVTILLNARYLLEPLSAMSSDKVRFFIRDDESHVILMPGDQTEYRCLIMPLRI
jgi:DNA polymerase-3 subunit beta